MRVVLLLLLMGLSMVAKTAQAQSPVDVARSWGLIGSWRYKCDVPASKDNVGQSWVVRNNQVVLERDYGTRVDRDPVTAVRVRPDGAIDLTMYFPELSSTRQNVFKKQPDGRLRTLISRDINTDVYFIKDGIHVASGQTFIFLTRCGN